MASQVTATHGVMEGAGSYNLHARIPAGGANLALPLLEEAVRNVTLEVINPLSWPTTDPRKERTRFCP